MKRNWMINKGLKFALFGLVLVGVCGIVVMSLWNWLMPGLFGLGMISFLQAVGLLILSRILFGGFRGQPDRSRHVRRRMMAEWQAMTPEQREKFRERMRRHGCEPFRPQRMPGQRLKWEFMCLAAVSL